MKTLRTALILFGIAALLFLASRLFGGSDARVRELETRVDSARAVIDTLRTARQQDSTTSAATIDSLQARRDTVEVRIPVIVGRRDSAVALTDSALAELPEVQALVEAERDLWRAQLQAQAELTSIARTEAATWKAEYEAERALRAELEAESALKDELIAAQDARLNPPVLVKLFRDLPKYVVGAAIGAGAVLVLK